MERKNIKIEVWQATEGQGQRFKRFVDAAFTSLAMVPAEYREEVRMDWYEDRLEAYYYRPETDSEAVEREERTKKEALARVERLRVELEQAQARALELSK
jgi:hypothetical protein